jgi:hypothetical protein
MGRQPEIEKILEAWWALDHCAPPERAKSESELNKLLDSAVGKSEGLYTRHQILDALWGHYKSYRLEKRKNEKVEVAQTAMKKT